jgi:hypothetical protein
MPTTKAQRRTVKAEAIELVRGLPSFSSWDGLMYRICVGRKIEAGLGDIEAGRVHSHAAIRKGFGRREHHLVFGGANVSQGKHP